MVSAGNFDNGYIVFYNGLIFQWGNILSSELNSQYIPQNGFVEHILNISRNYDILVCVSIGHGRIAEVGNGRGGTLISISANINIVSLGWYNITTLNLQSIRFSLLG